MVVALADDPSMDDDLAVEAGARALRDGVPGFAAAFLASVDTVAGRCGHACGRCALLGGDSCFSF